MHRPMGAAEESCDNQIRISSRPRGSEVIHQLVGQSSKDQSEGKVRVVQSITELL